MKVVKPIIRFEEYFTVICENCQNKICIAKDEIGEVVECKYCKENTVAINPIPVEKDLENL